MRPLHRRLSALAWVALTLLSCTDPTGPSRTAAVVEITATTNILALNASLQLNVRVLNAASQTIPEKPVEWSSLNPAVATVSSTGLVTAHAVGLVLIHATSDGVLGSISINVQYPACAAANATTTLTLGGAALSGTLAQTDCVLLTQGFSDGYLFSNAGGAVRFDLTGATFSPRIVITTPDLEVVGESAPQAAGEPARLSMPLPTGSYILWVSSATADLGAYTLTASIPTLCGPAEITAAIAVDEVATGELTAGSCLLPHGVEGQGWSFTLATESLVHFDVTAVGFDPLVVITDAALEIFDVGFGESGTGSSTAALPAGDYQVWVTTLAGGLGTFSVLRSALESTSCDAPVGVINGTGSVSGELTLAACQISPGFLADPWDLVVSVAGPLQIDLTSDAFDAVVALYDASGVLLDSDDDGGGGTNSRLAGVFAVGTYTIFVSTYDALETGPYSLIVAPVAGLTGGGLRAAEPVPDATRDTPKVERSRRDRRVLWGEESAASSRRP